MFEIGAALYSDRREAGRILADQLENELQDDAGPRVVLGLPRGGVVVAAEVASRMGVPADVLVVRKLGMPGQEELAMGAIASGGVTVLNREVASAVSSSAAADVARREHRELERREQIFRAGREPADISGKTAILVDDGLATGATMRAAIAAVRRRGAERAVVAVPVAPRHTIQALGEEADQIVCPATPEPFFGIGQFYGDFAQVSDDEVRRLVGAEGPADGARPL